MPRRHAQKEYYEDSYYHVYNRGVNKHTIFETDEDYRYFTKLLNFYLSPSKSEAERLFRNRPWRAQEHDLSRDVQLLAYCLMPNHFHFVVHLSSIDGLTRLMKRVSGSYSRYYNTRYDRTGHLYEGGFQARHIEDEHDLISTSAYVHRNPKLLENDLTSYPYSSLHLLANNATNTWTNPEAILNFFGYDSQAYVDYICNEEESPSDCLCLEPGVKELMEAPG